MDYIIATSSTSDLPRTWLEEHAVPFISYSYTVGETLCQDDCREETRAAVYQGMRKGDLLKTSMINEFVYYDFLKGLLDTSWSPKHLSSTFQPLKLGLSRIPQPLPSLWRPQIHAFPKDTRNEGASCKKDTGCPLPQHTGLT